MRKHILCFGDSNTHGYCADPNDCADQGNRFNEEERWTCRLQALLGDDYLVIEEGLGGRTTCFRDPLHEGMAGLDYLYPCLMTHKPIDLLILMLGTNDSKDRFHVSPKEIAIAMGRLVDKAKAAQDCWAGLTPNILVIAPPPIGEGIATHEVFSQTMGKHCHTVSSGLAEEYAASSKLWGVHFLDAVSLGCEFNSVDWTHLTRDSHAKLAAGLAEFVPTLL